MKIFYLFSLLVISGTSYASTEEPESVFERFRFPSVRETSYGDYTVRIRRVDGSCLLEIFHGGQQVYTAESHFFAVGYDDVYNVEYWAEKQKDIAMGKDITGDGIPNLVIHEWNGGNAGFAFHIFEIGENFRFVQTLYASELTSFINEDEDPAMEYPASDSAFFMWRTCHALSPNRCVVLKYRDGKYRIATSLMRKPAWTERELLTKARKLRTMAGWDLDEGDYWSDRNPRFYLLVDMLELIYGGNMHQAWELARRAWPKNTPGWTRFMNEFTKELRTSPYWDDLLDMSTRAR